MNTCKQILSKFSKLIYPKNVDIKHDTMVPDNITKTQNEIGTRPWGYYETVYGDNTSEHKVKRIVVFQNKRLSLQSHNKRVEHWTIVKGNAKIQIGEEYYNVGPNIHVYIPVNTVHRIENVGTDLLVFIETQIGDYLGEDDIIRYEDDFGRQ
jgi:mannose-1-phosphate guanylyltransferase/mannose-6-phosphate isomerase